MQEKNAKPSDSQVPDSKQHRFETCYFNESRQQRSLATLSQRGVALHSRCGDLSTCLSRQFFSLAFVELSWLSLKDFVLPSPA